MELGQKDLIELVGIFGYYGLISTTVNAFEVPLPEGPSRLPDAG